MSRPSRRPPASPRLAPALAAVAIVALAVMTAGCGPSAPLASIETEPTPLPSFEAARLGFFDLVRAGDLSYHATFDGRVYGAGNDIPLTGSLDVAGSDYQYTATYKLPDPATHTFTIRYVDGTAWHKVDKGKWLQNAGFKPADTNSPFAFITRASEVRYARTETVNGRALHHVTFTTGKLIAIAQVQAANVTNEDDQRTTFDLVLDDDGNPVSGTAEMEGVARVSDQLQEIVIQVNLVFSKVGDEIVIKAP